MAYQAYDYSHILGMQGISDTTLQNHFKLYQGYVNNTNTLLERTIQLAADGKEKTSDFAELRRRFGFEFDGMRLHEYYFENLNGTGTPDRNSAVYKKLAQDFGDVDRWKTDFLATGAMRGVGWAILFYDHHADRTLNAWVTLHQDNVLAGLEPLLVLDAWEHAYYLDHQTNRAAYLDAFMQHCNWQVVNQRFEDLTQMQQRRKAA